MTREAWRAAVTRWGDPLFGLALLLTDQRANAETTTIAAFRQVCSPAPPADPEVALYSALARSYRPPRWRLGRRWSRQAVLPRALRRVAPLDRLLLGLWLLRNVGGAQLVSILGCSGAELVARLAALLRQLEPDVDERSQALAFDQPAGEDAPGLHLTLERWLEQQLDLGGGQAEHVRVCPSCRAAQGHWHAARDRLRTLLVDLTRGQHLSQLGVEALEDALTGAGAETDLWWQQRRLWLPALLGGVGLLLAVLVVPWGGGRGEAETAAPPSAQALVRATLAAWASPPAEGTLHQRVQAINLTLRDSEPLVTDVWLDSRSPAHRVEVRRGQELVEWQLAEGVVRFSYGGRPALSSCRWNTGYSGHVERFDDAALNVRITPEQQQAARDARLRQGAYGAGYLLLQQALAAPDLRSFGARVEGGVTLTVLSFTDDRSSPQRQVLLQIDPRAQQLYAVQQVLQAGGQTQVRDLWRLQLQETPASGIPNDLPSWQPTKQLEQLVDPSCPALRPEYLVSLRQLTGQPYGWYMPGSLPPGTTSAAIFSPQPGTASAWLYEGLLELDALYVGDGRWLSITALDSSSRTIDGAEQISRDRWAVQLEQTPSQLWHGLVQPVAHTGFYTPALELWGAGWSRDELLAVVDSLQIFDVQLWRDMEPAFIDARPLSAQAHDALLGATEAIRPAPQRLSYLATRTTIRTASQPAGPSDPFFLPASARQPAQLDREQSFVANADGPPLVRDVWRLPDDTIFTAQTSDGQRLGVYYLPDGMFWNGTTEDLPLRFQQAELQLLLPLLSGSQPISFTEQSDTVLLEQTIPQLSQDALFTIFWQLFGHTPRIDDLSDGDGLLRLWLDRSTRLPQRLDLLHRSAQGQETPLSSIVVTERRQLDMPPPDSSLLAMPPLPDDTVTMDVVRNRAATLRGDPADTSWTRHSLTWPSSTGLSIVNEQPPRMEAAELTNLVTGRSNWYALEATMYWRQTRYQLPGVSRAITLTQGPRRVLRHVLRYSRQSPAELWSSSERLTATISGAPREVWLLRSATQSALVVEVDDLLLHIAGDPETLRGFVVEHLPELRPRADTP